ncbi:hypothetical protein ACLBX9_23460 [Methylobacterium sp. A49B]
MSFGFWRLSRRLLAMSGGVSKKAFAVAMRVQRPPQDSTTPSPEQPELRLPRIRPSEVAAAAGVDAVRRALEGLLVETRPAV